MGVESALNSTKYGSLLLDLLERQVIDALCVVAIHLLKEYEVLPQTPWRAYLSMLPAEYHTILHWTPEQRRLLTGTAAAAYWEQSTRPRWEGFVASMTEAYEWYPKVFGFTQQGLM